MRVYFLASITGRKLYGNYYREIVRILKKYGCEIEEYATTTTKESLLVQTVEERIRDHKKLQRAAKKADLIVAEASYPSTSAGYEIARYLRALEGILHNTPPVSSDLLKKRYPNWRGFTYFSSTEETKNEELSFLSYVMSITRQSEKFGLKNQWMAIETIPKPNRGAPYEKGIFKSGHYEDCWVERFDLPLDILPRICAEIKRQIEGVLIVPGSFNVRLPTAIEWNLLASRGVLDETTSTEEWCDPNYVESGVTKRLIIGQGDKNGRRYLFSGEDHETYTGFRLLIEFKFQNILE